MAALAVLVSTLLFNGSEAMAQGSTEYLPGKVYVIRMSPLAKDSVTNELTLSNSIKPALEEPMFNHFGDHLYRMRTAADGRWFVGYFNPDRQEQDVLMRDTDLLIWLFHGHDIQVMPIEMVRSPVSVPLLATPSR